MLKGGIFPGGFFPGGIFPDTAGYIPSTSYIQEIRNIWLSLLELKLIKNLIFQYKRAGLFVIQIVTISVANIWRHVNLSLVYQTRWK